MPTVRTGNAKSVAPSLPIVAPIINGFVEAQQVRCSWGLADQCKFAGVAYNHGIGVPRDTKRALSYFKRACSLGSHDGCVMSGVLSIELGKRTDLGDILTTWERACENGSYSGCHAAGATLALDPYALGIPRDIQRGRKYLAKACAARYLPACGMDAALTIELKETSSYELAREQLVQVCQLRERDSCHYLAQAELDGTFGTTNERAAGQHFWQACDDGLGRSCSALAFMHANGIATPVNADKARRLTARACALKYEPACEALRDPKRDLPPP